MTSRYYGPAPRELPKAPPAPPKEPRLEKREPPKPWPDAPPKEEYGARENKAHLALVKTMEECLDGKSYSTAIVPATSLAGLQVDALEQRIARYVIPPDEIHALADMLEKAKEKDIDAFKAGNGEAYAAAKAEAIVAYKKKHPLIKRILHRKNYKGWKDGIKVDVPKSERTRLLECIVETKDIVLEGYELFKDLPELLTGDYKAYGELKTKERKLEDDIKLMDEAISKAPEECRKCEEAMGLLSEYHLLSDDEKEKAKASIMETLNYNHLPKIDKEDVRKILIERISDAIAQAQLQAMNYNANLELARQELASVSEQQKLIEEQMEEMSKTWLPTLMHIDAARLRYDQTLRYGRSAAKMIGMNKLRERDTIGNIETKAAIIRTRKAQEDSRLLAEAYEEGAAETELLLEARAEFEEPVLMERKA